MGKERKYGEIQPGIKWGPFTMRVPGVHLKLSPSQHIQGGLILLATCGSITPLMMRYFEVSFEVAWTVSLVMLFWVLAQTVLFGDVYAAGAITPALPLTLVYMNTLNPGTEAIHGMMAIFILVTILFLFFGATKLGEKFNSIIPVALKGGIIMGAAIAAFQSEINRLPDMPFSLLTSWIIVLVLLFSIPFSKLPDTRSKIMAGSNALLISLVAAGIVGFFTGEMTYTMEWGLFVPPVAETFSTLSIWAVGLPSWEVFLAALPIALVIYVLAFGDLVVAHTLLKGADKARQDEKIDINPTRSHFILAARNLGQIMTAGPLLWIHGPIWTGVQVFLIERYKKGRNFMNSIFDGPMNFYIMAVPLGLLLPVIAIIMPIFPVALSISLLLTGFACAWVAMNLVKTNISRGLVLAIGMLTAVHGPVWGIGVGVVLYILLIGRHGEKSDESLSLEEDPVEEKRDAAS
ncbi:hypothetical protein [Alteribacter natronophilus]|uniref:hypothetical protein n=1 Tax=Alteribacter natronophilus TaxID=2583810 RepID=UPI001AED3F35|nr:hypothetical protein [Alteribacter natronophilus]